MTTTTALPKLTWAQFEELEDAAEKLGTIDWLLNQNGLCDHAANAEAIHACITAYDWGFDEELTDLYGKELHDPEFRNDLIALLTERNLTEASDGQRELLTDTIRQLQAIA